MFNSLWFCSALCAVFALPNLRASLGPVQDGLEDKNPLYVLSRLVNALSQTLLAIVLNLAAALQWPSWTAMAIARGALFCGATFEVVEIAGAIDAVYLQTWNTWNKVLLAGIWATATVALMVTSFIFDNDGATGTSLFAVSILIDYGIRLNWASRSIPTLRPSQRKPRPQNPLDEGRHASEILLGDSLRSLLYVLATFVMTALMASFPGERALLYTLQILIVNMLRASNASWKLLARWPRRGQPPALGTDSEGGDASTGDELDLPPQAIHSWFAGW